MAEPRTYSGNGHTATIADPESITRDECLALARCGDEVWNSWRALFPTRVVNGTYTNNANFSFQKFRLVDFSGFVFGDGASFEGAVFHFDGKFQGARFGRHADFRASIFEYDAIFRRAIFGNGLKFHAGLFCREADFLGASFGFASWFEGAVFRGRADFSASFFAGEANFVASDWSRLRVHVDEVPLQKVMALVAELGGSPGAFVEIDFSGAVFAGNCFFSGRRFLARSCFGRLTSSLLVSRPEWSARGMKRTSDGGLLLAAQEIKEGCPVKFLAAPNFHECKLHQDTSFDGAIFPEALGDPNAARAYRTLKLAFSQQQATREEQRFFRLEMAEEAKAAENSRDPAQWLYIAYRELADFGFSVRRPALLLVVMLVVMLPLYAWQAGLQVCWTSSADCNMTGPLIQFASAHALPGFEKLAEPVSKTLFGDQLGVWTVLTLLLHKAVSVLALFLIGLALRNLFKMK